MTGVNRTYLANFNRAALRLNFSTIVSFEKGVKEFVEHLRQGDLYDYPKTHTTEFYKTLMQAEKMIGKFGLNKISKIL